MVSFLNSFVTNLKMGWGQHDTNCENPTSLLFPTYAISFINENDPHPDKKGAYIDYKFLKL